jgi:transporter family-2 protein
MRLDFIAMMVGLLTAIQSRANGELSIRIDNSLQASLISFSSGLVLILAISIWHPGIKKGAVQLRAAVRAGAIPRWRLFGGVLGGFLVAIQTQIVPIIGVAIYSVTMIAGQTTASLWVDHSGFTGGEKKLISRRRILAAVVTVAAVLVSVWDRIDAKNLSMWAVFMGVFAGFFIGVQRALNGQVNQQSQQSFTTSLLNFIMGTSTLVIVVILGLIFHKFHFSAIVPGPWWMFLGGVTGVIYVAFSATVVQQIGLLSFTLFSVGGQLVGSLLIDFFSPTRGVQVGPFLIAGIVLTYLGVLINNESVLKKHRFSLRRE